MNEGKEISLTYALFLHWFRLPLGTSGAELPDILDNDLLNIVIIRHERCYLHTKKKHFCDMMQLKSYIT